MMNYSPLFDIDFYKAGHHRQYPPGTQYVYSNFTARSAKLANIPEAARDGVVFFGLQHFLSEFLSRRWGDFFLEERPHISAYKALLDRSLGGDNDVSHIYRLWDLGYLPIRICALPEGTLTPVGVPMLTIENTHPDFFWLTNFLETALSAYLWKPITSATTARYYRALCETAAHACDSDAHVDFQCHDFSMRGMSGVEDAAISGLGHLVFFKGTDCVPAILAAQRYYGSATTDIGFSVPATEHSVMSMGGEIDELATFRRLIVETYPSGILSIVSDTWDFWQVLTR